MHSPASLGWWYNLMEDIFRREANSMARGRSPARGKSPKKDKVILLLKQGETSISIIANKVGCGVVWVSVVKRELIRSQKA